VGFKSIGIIDFCEVTKECVFETEDWFYNCKSESIGIIDFCEVTKEGVLERKRLVFLLGNLSALV
jgi:hypothetical protein